MKSDYANCVILVLNFHSFIQYVNEIHAHHIFIAFLA